MNDHPASSGDEVAVAGHRELLELLDGYASLSRDYVDAQQPRLALLAMWSSDVHVLQVLLLESGLDKAPDPAARLAGVGEALNSSLTAMSLGSTTPREFLERSREAMVTTFDESVHALLADRFLPLDHLEAVNGRAVDSADRAVEQRLDGRIPELLLAELEATAPDCVAVAGALFAAGDVEGGLRQMHHADLASFEGFLLRTALESGDGTLASVDLSWDLAARAFAEQPMRLVDNGDVVATVDAWRERLVMFGGWARAGRMRASFLPVPAA